MTCDKVNALLQKAGLRVKPLEWEAREENEECLERHCAFGLIDEFRVYKDDGGFSVLTDDGQMPDETVTFSTLDKAKAWCQTDLEKQLLQWLEVAP